MSALDALIQSTGKELSRKFARSKYGTAPAVDLIVLVAHADGRVDDQEHTNLARSFGTLIVENLRDDIAEVLVSASIAAISEVGVAKRAEEIGHALADLVAADLGLTLGVAIAMSSEGMSKEEREVLHMIATAAGEKTERIEEIETQLRSEMSPPTA